MLKKFLFTFVLFFSFIYFFCIYTYNLQSSISDKIIRLHVIANSNSEYDQFVKLRVRDNIVQFLSPLLKNCENINESRVVIAQNLENIETLANDTLANYGSCTANAKLAESTFPTKTYGNYSFPAGNYESLKITIGEGNGENWWCVMFPPLCFTDSSIEFSEDSVETLKENLSDKELEFISNSQEPKIQIKFKLLEWLNK